jgi:hypothetical protein
LEAIVLSEWSAVRAFRYKRPVEHTGNRVKQAAPRITGIVSLQRSGGSECRA